MTTNQPQTISFQGTNVYLLNDLITYDRTFFVGCMRESRKTIQKKNIPEDQYWFATYSKRTQLWSPAILENCKAKILISEDWVHSNVPMFTGDQDAYKFKPLPPLLELSESEKFRDEMGNVYEVEVRGEKTKDDIRFRWRDVAQLFEMKDDYLRHILIRTEYFVFCSDKAEDSSALSEQNTGGQPTSTYLTYNGLLKIIFASRSGTAYRFQDWATNIIYGAHLGNTEERLDVAAAVVDTDVENMRRYFEEQLRMKELECEQYQQERNRYQQDLQDKEYYIQETKRHNLLLNELMINNSKIEPTQVVYIATSQSYANQNRFKVGGVESVSKLQSRLTTYNSRSAAGDDFYFSDVFLVADYRQIETRLKSLMLRFRDRASKEIYVLHYSNIQYIVKYFCDHYNEELDYVNDHLLQFIDNLNRYTLRPVVPEKTSFNYASITSCQEDGSVHVSTIQTDSRSELVRRIEEYVEGLRCTEISKKEVFDGLGIGKGRRELLPLVRSVLSTKRPDIVLASMKK